MLRNQKYDICIRQEVGFCSFDVSQTTTSTTKRAFLLSTPNTAAKVNRPQIIGLLQNGLTPFLPQKKCASKYSAPHWAKIGLNFPNQKGF